MNLLDANDRPGTYPPGWYLATAEPLAPFPTLQKHVQADLCVIGGGFTGLSAALHAAKAGLDVVLLDAQRVGFGASGRNGGQVQSGFRASQKELEQIMGRSDARMLWDISQDAMDLTKNLVADHAPEASFKPGIAHADWHDPSDDYAEADYLAQHYDFHLEKLTQDEMYEIIRAPGYKGGVLDPQAGHLHPLRYALGLAQACADAGVRIFEMSRVSKMTSGRVTTDTGSVTADQIIQATNGYGTELSGGTKTRVIPINNFIVATEPLDDPVLTRDIAVSDSKFVVNYFRMSEDNRLLFGGGENYSYHFPKDMAGVVRKPMEQVFPQLKGIKIDYAWGGTLAITGKRLPFVGQPGPGIWAAAGYSGHGVALSTMVGKILANAAMGEVDQAQLLSKLPTPVFPGGAALRSPLLVLAMTWYAMRDRLGI